MPNGNDFTLYENLGGVTYAPSPVDYTPAPIRETERAVPDESAFTRAFKRSIDETQAMAAGGVGALGDLLSKSAEWAPLSDLGEYIRDWGFDEYLNQMEEASYRAPDVGQIENINDPATFFTWVAETAGGLAPSALGAIASSGVGAVAAKGIGSLIAKKLSSNLVKRSLRDRVGKLVAKGVATKEARKQALKELVERTAKRSVAGLGQKGAQAGIVGYSSAIESGANWADDAEKHGLENTKPAQDILFGIASGMTEVFGGEASLVRSVTGRLVPKSTERAVRDTFKKQLAKGIASGAAQEGSQEFIQETLSAMNANILDGRALLTDDDVSSLINAFAAGAVGGVFFGAGGSLTKQFKAGRIMEEEDQKAASKMAPTVEEADKEVALAESVADSMDKLVTEVENKYAPQLEEAAQRYSQVQSAFQEATQKNDPALQAQLSDELIKLSAEQSALKKAKQKELDDVEKQRESLLKNADKVQQKALNAEIKAGATGRSPQNELSWRHLSPEEDAQLNKRISQIEDFTNRQYTRHTVRLAEYKRQLEELKAEEVADPFFLEQEKADLEKRIDDEVKWSSKLFQKAEDAVRKSMFHAAGEPYRATQAVNDLYNHGKEEDGVDVARKTIEGTAITAREELDNLKWFNPEVEQNAEALVEEADIARRAELAEQTYESNQLGDQVSLEETLEDVAEDTYEQDLANLRQVALDFSEMREELAEPSYREQVIERGPMVVEAAEEAARRIEEPAVSKLKKRYSGAKEAQARIKPKRVKRIDQEPTTKRTRIVNKPVSHTKKVEGWVSKTTERLHGIKKDVIVVPEYSDNKVPDYVRKKAEHWKAAYDGNTGKIFVFANRIRSQEDAAAQVLHEAVGHHGLAMIFTKEEKESFLKSVYTSFFDTDQFKLLTKGYDGLNPLDLAEEYVARLAENVRVGKVLDKKEKTVWRKFKRLIRRVLEAVGIKKVSKYDINHVINASLFYVANKNNKSFMKRVTSVKDIRNVRGSVSYQKWVKDNNVVPKIKYAMRSWEFSKKGLNPDGSVRAHEGAELFVEAIADRFRRMLTVQRALKDRGGKITPKSDVYQAEELNPNITTQRKQEFMEKFVEGADGLVGLLEKARTKGESPNTTLEKCAKLAYAIHAKERNAELKRRGLKSEKGSGMSNEEAQKIINEMGLRPEYMAVVEKVREINEERLNILEKFHLYPKHVIDTWRNTYRYYVPLKNWEEQMQEVNPSYSLSGKSNSYSASTWVPSKYALGRSTLAENPILHSVMQVKDTIDMAGKAEVGRALLNLVRDNKDATDLWVEEGNATPKTRIKVQKDGTLKEVKADPFSGMADNVVTVIDDKGFKIKILIKDTALANAFKGANAQQGPLMKKVARFSGKLIRRMAVANTTLNPAFILSNAFRDALSAAVNFTRIKNELAEYNIPKGIEKEIYLSFNQSRKAIFNAVHKQNYEGEWGEWFKKYRENGGFTEMFGIQDYDTLNDKLVKQMKDMSREGLGGKAIGKVKDLYNYMDSQASSFENMVRLATFRRIAEVLVKQHPGNESFAYKRAASVALNLTVNFTKRGTLAPWFTPLFMFANASIQSNVRFLKTIFTQEKGKKWYEQRGNQWLSALLAAPVAMGIIGRALGGDDEDGIPYYDKIADWEKNNNLILMLPGTGGDYLKIPLPYGFSLFTTIGNMSFSMTKDVDAPSAAKSAMEVMKAAMGNFSPIGQPDEGWTMFVPTLLRPIAQIETNSNFFGQPIRPEQQFYQKGELPDSQKYWDNCNGLAKGTALTLNSLTGGSEARPGLIDISPETIEHVVSSYLGGLGKFISRSTELLHRKSLGLDSPVNGYPVLRRVVGSVDYYQTLPIYANIKTRVETDVNEYKLAREAGLPSEELSKIVRRTQKGRLLSTALDNTGKQFKELNKRMKEARKRLKDDAAALYRYEDEIRKRKYKLMKNFLSTANKRNY